MMQVLRTRPGKLGLGEALQSSCDSSALERAHRAIAQQVYRAEVRVARTQLIVHVGNAALHELKCCSCLSCTRHCICVWPQACDWGFRGGDGC